MILYNYISTVYDDIAWSYYIESFNLMKMQELFLDQTVLEKKILFSSTHSAKTPLSISPKSSKSITVSILFSFLKILRSEKKI